MPIGDPGEALLNVPTSVIKRLSFLTDLQARTVQRGPTAATAVNLITKGPTRFERTAPGAGENNVTFADPRTGLLRLAEEGEARHEVNGLLLEPETVIQYLQSPEAFDNVSNWSKTGGLNITPNFLAGPDGISTADAFVNSSGTTQGVSQSLGSPLFDPASKTYSFSCFLKHQDVSAPPQVRFTIAFTGGGPPTTGTTTVTPTANGSWQRYDVILNNTNAAHTAGQVSIELLTNGSVIVWGANFTEGGSPLGATFAYRPAFVAPNPSGVEVLEYDITAMGLEPSSTQTLFWEFIPIGSTGFHAPYVALGGVQGELTSPFTKYIAFGSDPNGVDRLAVVDTAAGGAPIIHQSVTTYSWTRFSHQKWAFMIQAGGTRIDFFANGLYLGQKIVSALTNGSPNGNFTKFFFPQGAIHRRLELFPQTFTQQQLQDITTL